MAALAIQMRESVNAEGRAVMRHLILLLAEGEPVSLERIAMALKHSPDEVGTTLRQLSSIELSLMNMATSSVQAFVQPLTDSF